MMTTADVLARALVEIAQLRAWYGERAAWAYEARRRAVDDLLGVEASALIDAWVTAIPDDEAERAFTELAGRILAGEFDDRARDEVERKLSDAC